MLNPKILFLFLTLISCIQTKGQAKKLIELYDYSQIVDHPRLLLRAEDESVVKFAINQNPEFKKIDTYINQISDDLS